jgi:hypothetical protein
MANELNGHPAYTGMTCQTDHKGGYSVWLPSDWHQTKLKRNHRGFLFSPYPDDINTSILVEKKKLKVTITPDDIDILRAAFQEDIRSLPGVEIELFEESLSNSINFFDARFTFLEDENRRKRWVRNIYWGNGQLIVIAQGRTPEDFEYWLPMFYNAITTIGLI